MGKKILQFGTGRFLRAFVDAFVQETAQDYSVTVIQSTPGPRAQWINDSESGYPIFVRGIREGNTIDERIQIQSVEKALVAETEWDQIIDMATSPDLSLITSNTTESSYLLEEADQEKTDSVPRSYPAKLTSFLRARFDSGNGGITLAPCELVENNGSALQGLVLKQAEIWNEDTSFTNWLTNDCIWLDSLVDRMVVPPSEDDPALKNEPLCAVTEPFALWAIKKIPGQNLPFIEHPAIQWVDDLDPYFLRKVRILNGAHTAMVVKYLPKGYETVKQVMADPEARDWVRSLMFEEIVPTIAHRVEGAATFAFDTLDRLTNPFFDHRLKDIAAGHEDKLKIRLAPTHAEYETLFGSAPSRISEALQKAQ